MKMRMNNVRKISTTSENLNDRKMIKKKNKKNRPNFRFLKKKKKINRSISDRI